MMFGWRIVLLFVAVSANRGWVFRQSCTGNAFVPGKHIVLENVPAPSKPQAGELAIQLVATSVIPSYRVRMDVEKHSESTAFTLNKPLVVEIVAKVIESNAPGFAVGDRIQGYYPLVEQQVIRADGSDAMLPPTKLRPEISNEKALSLLSLGGGFTSLFGVEYFEPGKVETPCNKTIMVTSAASAVGQIVGQLYKLKGCKVIGSTSTSDKAQQVLALGGFDHIISYQEENLDKRLGELAPEGIDIDFENVCGAQLDAVLRHMNERGRVLVCGAASSYNGKIEGVTEWLQVIFKKISIHGLHVGDIFPHFSKATELMSSLIAEGKLKSQETIMHGLEKWGEGLNMLLESKNIGRLVITADDPSKTEL